jgi:copper oxidase (laccase) domain-containing protein
MKSQPTWAWLGAAISQPCFEVGAEVKAIFCEKYPELAVAFISGQTEGKYQADLYAIARFILNSLGVETVLGGDQCSYQQDQDYFLIDVMQKRADGDLCIYAINHIWSIVDSPCDIQKC